MQAVGCEGRLGHRMEAAVRVLHEQFARLPLAAANVDVVAAVAVDVADRERRAFRREQMGHQRLAPEVEERVLFVLVADGHPIGDVRKQRRMGGWADGGMAARVGLRQRDRAVGRYVLEHLLATIGPDHRQRVDPRCRTQPKVGARVNR